MSARWKTGLFVFFVLALFLMAGWTVWYLQIQRKPSIQTNTSRPLTYSFPTQAILTYNNSIEKKSDVTPHYALSGTVIIGSGDSRYGLRLTGESGLVYYPLDVTAVARGSIYRSYKEAIQRILQVESLGMEDEIYLTYYADYSAGRAYGIVERVERSGNSVTIRFLEDPDDTRYNISTSTELATYDPSLFFELNGKTVQDLAEGQIVWLTFPPRTAKNGTVVTVSTATLRGPPYRVLRGTVEDVEVGSDSVLFHLSTFPHQIRADATTLVYSYRDLPEMGVANYRKRNLPVTSIVSGKRVALYTYVAGDHWQALAVGLDQTRE